MALAVAQLQVTSSISFSDGSGNYALNQSANVTYSAGSGVNQVQYAYGRQRTVASSSSPDVLNLTSGLSQPDGTAIVFAALVRIYVINNSTAAGTTITVGGGTNPVIAAQQPIGPGGRLLIDVPDATAIPVTSGSAYQLQIASNATATPYSIQMVGR